jgi:hypothetical protein
MLTALKAEVDSKAGASGGKLTLDILAKNSAITADRQLRSLYPETVRIGSVTESDEKSKTYTHKFKTESKIVREESKAATKGPIAKAGIKPAASKTKSTTAVKESQPSSDETKVVPQPLATKTESGTETKSSAPATEPKATSGDSAPANAAPATTSPPVSRAPAASPAPESAGGNTPTNETTPATVAPTSTAPDKNGG